RVRAEELGSESVGEPMRIGELAECLKRQRLSAERRAAKERKRLPLVSLERERAREEGKRKRKDEGRKEEEEEVREEEGGKSKGRVECGRSGDKRLFQYSLSSISFRSNTNISCFLEVMAYRLRIINGID
ncbi:MAG: hypothetical protein ACRD4L_02135, partial [Pyrinomonadaceae bacterium]